jgi:hypothetical protein
MHDSKFFVTNCLLNYTDAAKYGDRKYGRIRIITH